MKSDEWQDVVRRLTSAWPGPAWGDVDWAVWYEELAGYEYEAVRLAIRGVMVREPSRYPPSLGMLVERTRAVVAEQRRDAATRRRLAAYREQCRREDEENGVAGGVRSDRRSEAEKLAAVYYEPEPFEPIESAIGLGEIDGGGE